MSPRCNIAGCLIVVFTALLCLVSRPAPAEDELRSVPDLRFTNFEANHILTSSEDSSLSFTELLQAAPLPSKRQRRRHRLNIDPILHGLLELVREAGVPLDDYRDKRRGSLVGVSASFRVADDIPPVHFHLGERSPEPLGAFYSTDSDVSWAFSIPVRQFTFRLEGGDESEFGYYAIAGTHWHHPERPLAVGVGIPMQLRDAEGKVGLVCQFRMQLP